jgi:MFS family permease
MDVLRDAKLHIIAFLVVIICELIGKQSIWIIPVYPMLYAMILGGTISIPKLKILTNKNMQHASIVMMVTLMLLVAKLGVSVGPKIDMILEDAKLALIFQELGHFAGTILLGLPLAMLLGMKREAVGATYSVAREPNIAIVADKYGLDSPEGRGVMAMYVCGTLYGAIWMSILASLIAKLNILHPYALAMGAGVGSGSMMAASLAPISDLYPDLAENINAYATTANLMSSIVGIYIYTLFSLPFASFVYNTLARIRRNK